MAIQVLSSGKRISSTCITSASARFYGVNMISDKSNDAEITIYNNTVGGGQVVFEGECPKAEKNRTMMFPMKNGIWCPNGIYLGLVGNNAAAIVYYTEAWLPDDP